MVTAKNLKTRQTVFILGDKLGALCFALQNNFVRVSDPPFYLFHFEKWYGTIFNVGGIGK